MTRAFRWGTDGTPAARAEIEADAKIITELTVKQPLNTLGSPTSTYRVAHRQLAENSADARPPGRGSAADFLAA